MIKESNRLKIFNPLQVNNHAHFQWPHFKFCKLKYSLIISCARLASHATNDWVSGSGSYTAEIKSSATATFLYGSRDPLP